jgi:NADH-quinone oxidoreductase subunit N
MGKLLLFVAAFQAHLYWLLVVAVGGVVVSIYYYFGWIKAAFFEPLAVGTPSADQPASAVPTWVGKLVLGALALATVVLGFYPGPLTHWLPFK